jgi:hypothetical protein
LGRGAVRAVDKLRDRCSVPIEKLKPHPSAGDDALRPEGKLIDRPVIDRARTILRIVN